MTARPTRRVAGRSSGYRWRRWFRSLQAQLLLWAVLPVSFAVIAIAFTGIYAHQQSMRDFVADRDLALARVGARAVENGLAYGAVRTDGAGLVEWLSLMLGSDAPGIAVLDAQGVLLAHAQPSFTDADAITSASAAVAQGERDGAIIIPGPEGDLVLVAIAQVATVDWVVVVSEPVDELIGPVLRLPVLAPIAAGAAGLISLSVFAFGWLTIVRPLQRLSRAADQVSWGEYSAISQPVGGVQEVRDLHRSLGAMVERIQGYQAGMQDYLGAVTEGQEAERARLAHELHDGPVQDLIALVQQADMAQRLLDRGETAHARQLLAESRRAEVVAVESLRRLIGDLRPVYLEDLGLVPALQMLIAQARERTNLQIRLDAPGTDRRYGPEIELASYRIVQEAVSNAIQHAQAQTIDVTISRAPDELILSVSDDGRGFALPAKADVLTRKGHFGLVGMRERTARLGGALEIRTAPGQGTRVTAHLPLRPEWN